MNTKPQNNESENLVLINETAQKILELLEPLGLDEQVAAVGLVDTIGAYKAATRSRAELDAHQAELDAQALKPVVPSHQPGQSEP